MTPKRGLKIYNVLHRGHLYDLDVGVIILQSLFNNFYFTRVI